VKVRIDRERCLGVGNCVAALPTVFDQDSETGLVILLEEAPAEENREAVEYAVVMCPGAAISIEYETDANSDELKRSV
jgi:ferredoxin